MNESDMFDRYREAERDYYAMCAIVQTHCMALASAALQENDVVKAKQVLLDCPDTVAKAFIADAIREHIKVQAMKLEDYNAKKG